MLNKTMWDTTTYLLEKLKKKNKPLNEQTNPDNIKC